jgi:hypothetical protein
MLLHSKNLPDDAELPVTLTESVVAMTGTSVT